MAKIDKTTKQDLTSYLKKLSEISEWFEGQEEIDVEEGLKKVKAAAALIKASKERLKAVENEFEEIKKEIELEDDDKGKDDEKDDEDSRDDSGEPDVKDIPF